MQNLRLSVREDVIISDNCQAGRKIQKLSINFEQHLLNPPDSIFLHLKEGLKGRMIPSTSIWIRDQRKGQGQQILLQD